MTFEKRRQIEERMRALDNRALLRLVAIESSDYLPEALEIACDELKLRHLDVLNGEQYLEQFPSEKIGSDGFCEHCRSQTTDESPGNTRIVNFIFGTRLSGHDDRCASCGSVLQTKWLWIGLPILPLGRYRVIYRDGNFDVLVGLLASRQKYVGRRLKKKR